jgi:cysteine-rich repeat protein
MTATAWWVLGAALGVIALACDTGERTTPSVVLALGDETLRDDVRDIRLVGYRDAGVSCADHALSGTPSGAPEVGPLLVTEWQVTFPASAGEWVFHVTAGNADFPIDRKKLAEGCTAQRIAAGSEPQVVIELHDMRPDYCGDGTLDPGEDCDNGPDVPDDGCDAECRYEAGRCGDGVVDIGETCDPGTDVPDDHCSASCRSEVFRLSGRYFLEEQSQVRVAAGTEESGEPGFVTVWTDSSGRSGDSRPPGVVIAFLDRNGAFGPNPTGGAFEYRVNVTASMGPQNSPGVGFGSEGCYAVYIDARSGDWDLFGRPYGRAHNELPSGEVHVPATYAGTNEQMPVVGAHPAQRNYVVAWATGTTGSRRISFRVIDSAGTPASADTPVQPGGTADEYLPAIAMAADGSFAVAWVQAGGDGDGTSIQRARFTAAGAPNGTPELVNTTYAGMQTEPGVAIDATGRMLVAWADGREDGEGGVRARLYPATGTAADDFEVSTDVMTVGGSPERALVAAAVAAGEGVFLVAWSSRLGAFVAGRLVSDAGAFRRNRVTGDEGVFVVGAGAEGGAEGPGRVAVAVAPGGAGMVAWEDSGTMGDTDADGGVRAWMLPVP